MVISEQVLGCRAPMRRVLVLLFFSLLGLLGRVQAQDCEYPKRANMSLIDEDILKKDFPVGSMVTFECATGYRSKGGSGETTCEAGTWTPPTLKCERFNCESLALSNGHVDYIGGTSFGDKATFSCNEGYILSGSTQLTCGDKSWLGRPPTCSVVKCGSAPSVVNAEGPSPDRETYDFSYIVSYKCLKDYTINGSRTLKCSSHGTFTPNPPTCIMVSCKPPIIPNGSQKSGARPPYKFKNSVEFECNPGFKMDGIGYMTCLLNSTWSSMPECKAIITTTTMTPTTPTTTTMTPKTPTTTTMTPKTPTTTSKNDVFPTGLQSWWFIGLIVVIVIIIIITAIVLVFWVIRKKLPKKQSGAQPLRTLISVEEDKML